MTYDYSIFVCPFCGAQWGSEDDWPSPCEHRYMKEYGSIEPLEIELLPLPTIWASIQEALVSAAPRLEAQRKQHMAQSAKWEAKHKARWDALTPEQQEQERKTAASFNRILKESYLPFIRDEISAVNRQCYTDAK
jgi:hypothetical protein